MLLNLRHSAIVVRDLNKALNFYKDFLGLKVITTKLEKGKYIESLLGIPNIKVTTVKLGTTEKNSLILLELYHFEDGMAITLGGFHHISFTVNDIKTLRMFLLGKGIIPISEPQLDQDKKHLVMFVRDYDGNLIELCECLT
jgi:catechol 2,3-dioxygenase-like lactoylglutathione lyase family enzyme